MGAALGCLAEELNNWKQSATWHGKGGAGPERHQRAQRLDILADIKTCRTMVVTKRGVDSGPAPQREQSAGRLPRPRSLTSSLAPSHRPSSPARLLHMHTTARALTWPNRTASYAYSMCCALSGPRCIRSGSNNGRANRSLSTGKTASSVTSEGRRPSSCASRPDTRRQRNASVPPTPSTMLQTPLLPPLLRPVRTLSAYTHLQKTIRCTIFYNVREMRVLLMSWRPME